SADGRSVELTQAGAAAAEEALGGIDLYSPDHLDRLTAVNLALYARTLLHRDVEYIVRDGKVDLVDEYRGRVAHRRRWPDAPRASSAWCSTPATTPRRRRSSPRPAGRARSPCRRRWPAGGSTSGSAAGTRRAATGSPTWAGCTWSAAAGTTVAGSTTSCAAGPGGRATRAARCSSSASRTTWS